MFKCMRSPMSESFQIVHKDFGRKFEKDGKVWSWEPVPVVRVPIGYGRTAEQAEKLAMWLVQCMNAGLAFDDLPFDLQCATFGIRDSAELTFVA